MIPQMAKDTGVTEQMKMTDRVGMMNAIKNQAEEIIRNKIIHT